jgi:sec-independent protein translocase protein TatB
MFDIGASELLMIVIVAIVVIGPKDLPLAMRTAGRWIAKIRRVSGHFRAGVETMIREAELEEMERKWREQNEAIMKAHPAPEGGWPEDAAAPVPGSAESALPPPQGEALARDGETTAPDRERAEPQLPLPPP